jgi:hypothetical protein
MTTPNSPEKMAERLYQKLLNPKSSLDYSDPTTLIAAALREYGEACRKEEWDKKISTWSNPFDVRRAALEEAAKVVEEQPLRDPNPSPMTFDGWYRARELTAKAIRALSHHSRISIIRSAELASSTSAEGGKMTIPELLQALQKCNSGDREKDHVDADELLLKFIDNQNITRAFEAIEKWYA